MNKSVYINLIIPSSYNNTQSYYIYLIHSKPTGTRMVKLRFDSTYIESIYCKDEVSSFYCHNLITVTILLHLFSTILSHYDTHG